MNANSKRTTCTRAQDAVAYLRDELDENERTAFEAHLHDCSACREESEQFKQVAIRILAEAPRQPCRDMAPAIHRILRSEHQAGTPGKRLTWPMAMLRAATVLAFFSGALILGSRFHNQTQRQARLTPPAQALQSGLAWLATAQSESGAWDPRPWGGRKEYETALTGLTLLSFLRNPGNRPPQSATVVERGAKHLLAQQGENGSFGPSTAGLMYNHGIAAVALLEARRQGAANSDKEDAALQAALNFIREQQHANGGWGYDRRPASRPNTSVTVWQIEALLLAAEQGMTEWNPTLERGLRWLHSMAGGSGRFGYEQTGDTEEDGALSAMGAYCLFKAAGNSDRNQEALALALRALDRAAAIPARGPSSDYYQSFFLASALKASANPDHSKRLALLQASLTEQRNASETLAGSWNPSDQWGQVGGRIYATAMATMTL